MGGGYGMSGYGMGGYGGMGYGGMGYGGMGIGYNMGGGMMGSMMGGVMEKMTYAAMSVGLLGQGVQVKAKKRISVCRKAPRYWQ